MTVFWKKFATMLGNGVPLVATLLTLRAEQTGEPMGSSLQRIVDDVKAGVRFSEALAKHPGLFGADVVLLAASGENQGRLDEVAAVIGQKFSEGLLSLPAAGSVTPPAGPADSGPTYPVDVLGAPPQAALEALIALAVEVNASDIHFDQIREPERGVGGRVRFRIDGLLEDRGAYGADAYRALLAALKTMSCLDVAETRLPQDGRMLLEVKGQRYDLRASVGPTVLGEGACLRILSQKTLENVLSSPELVFPEEDLRQALFSAAASTSGLFIATGPTGSGKTTTMYSLLARQDTNRSKVLSVEDPVEVILPGVHQTAVRPALGMTFVSVLRHFMRMDPDVVSCSEVRDVETAVFLHQIALTGHLTFTQLHAPDAIGALLRLLDLGLEPYLVADALIGITGQRLVRKLCTACREADPEGLPNLRELAGRLLEGASPAAATLRGASGPLFRPRGCDRCAGSGFRGRRPIYEYLQMTPSVRRALRRDVNREQLVAAAAGQPFLGLLTGAIPALLKGETSLSEVLRVC
jgi:type II secretory ATPase GspE/PulE/Tfp pilus assembly ATPase PilB-like protein